MLALVTKRLDINVTVDNEDSDFANLDGVTLLNEYLITVVVCRIHTVTANRDSEVSLFRFCAFGNKQILSQIPVKDITRTSRVRLIKRTCPFALVRAIAFTAAVG